MHNKRSTKVKKRNWKYGTRTTERNFEKKKYMYICKSIARLIKEKTEDKNDQHYVYKKETEK